jgi:pilus assembly protein CpaB
MPRLPGWAWLLMAIGFATLATYMAMGYLKRQAAVQPVRAKIYVVRSNALVEKEKILSAAQLKRFEWDKEKPPQDFFSELKDVEGRETVKTLAGNEIITRENTRKPIPGLAGKVGRNERAITVKVDEASGVGGFVTPDSRVDVVAILNKGEYNKNPISKTILQNLKVLGTGQQTEIGPGDKPKIVPTVTLEVTPEQAEYLALNAQEGRISLVLRGQLPVGTLGADDSTPKPVTTAPLSPNQRAATVKVDTASRVAPGNRVDVALLLNTGAWEKYPVAKIIFHNMEVLDTDKQQRVTLIATPQEAVDLIWAAQVGHLSLMLRSGDKTFDKNKEVMWTSARRILGNLDQLSPPRTVEVLRGVEMGAEVPLVNKYRSASVPTSPVRR